MDVDELFKRYENGKLILSEEEIMKKLMEIPSFVIEYHLNKIKNYLSIERLIELIKAKHITKYIFVFPILMSINDADQLIEVIKGLGGLNSDYKEIFHKFSDEDKVKLLPYLNDEVLIAYILRDIKNDDLIKESLHYINNEHNKSIIISSMSNDDYKVELINEIKNDEERGRVIYSMNDDEKKFPLMDSISNEIVIKQLILSFKDENMIVNLIGRLSKIDNKILFKLSQNTDNDSLKLKLIELSDKDYYVFDILNSIKDFETYKKGLILLKDIDCFNDIMYRGVDLFSDSQKIELIPYISSERKKRDILLSLEKDEDKIRLIDYIQDDTSKRDIISSMKDNSNKIDSLNKISEDALYYRRDIVMGFDNDDDKIKSFKFLPSEFHKASVIATLNDSSKKLEFLNDIQEIDNKIKIIKSLNTDEERIKILYDVKDLEYKSKIIPLINDERLRVKQIVNLSDEKMILNFAKKLSNEGKKYIIENIVDSRCQVDIILSFNGDEKEIIELAKNIKFNIGSSLCKIAPHVSDETKLELIKMLSKFETERIYIGDILETIKDDDLFIDGLKYGVKYVRSTLKDRINKFDESTKVKLIPSIKDTFYVYELVKSFEAEENKMKCIKYIDGNSTKISIIKGLSRENAIKSSRAEIDGTIDLFYASRFADDSNYPMDEFKEMILLEEAAVKSQNNIEFRDNYLKLSGYASKYRVITKYKAKEENIDIVDEIINKFIDECRNTKERYEIISRLSDNALLKYKEELNNAFDNGDYSNLCLFDNSIIDKVFDNKKSKILKEYKKLKGNTKKHFAEYVHDNFNAINEDKVDEVIQLIFDVETSNSEEISKQSDSFIANLLSSDDALDKFNKIENIFLTNNLPRFAKTYLTFLIVHPNFDSYIFKNTGGHGHYVSSPVLNNISPVRRKALILMDLLKCSLKSNSTNFVEYINKLEKLNSVYLENKDKEFDYLDSKTKQDLMEFRNCVLTLYDNYLRHRIIDVSDNAVDDLNKFSSILCNNNDRSIADSIISGYCGLIGINSIAEAKKYIMKTKSRKNEISKNRYENNDFTIQQGDFIKGFNINYFSDMMQNGIVAKDYLGADMNTDLTALDTDLSRIYEDTTGMSIEKIIDLKDEDSGMFGQGYIILKDNPKKITITSKSGNEQYSREEIITKENMFDNKLEAFSNGTGYNISNPYGIRTGFSVSDVDFIVFDETGGTYRENIYKITLPLVMNGIYVPIISKQTEKVLFTYEQFEELSSKMEGLKKFNKNEFNLSENIESDEYRLIASEIDDSNKVIDGIKEKIFNKFREGLGDNFNIVSNITGKLEKGEVQILDTGSTSRSTNIPYDGDFDFIVRIDRNLDIDGNLKNEFIKNLISEFDMVDGGKNINGDIKGMVINIDGNDYKLDLSFVRKTDKVSYSSEMCVTDRLDTIKECYPDKYKLVLANIIYAKKYLSKKGNECYKKCEYGQGGLGGIGVENWILQNGGSFYDASVDFISHAYKDDIRVPFDEFINNYHIWDFGENFYTDRDNRINNRNNNLHDNFVSNNLTEDGYNRMCDALKRFIFDYKFGDIKLDNEVNEVNDTKAFTN